jgi:hypothetical protein
MNMYADPENNALFNSGPLNKPIFYVWGEVTSLSGADKREVRDNREKW